ncbi:MAG: hypothetical protein COT90_02825 [Candidatus Diapherotrites archaeon CG10_big_fil_rev_8_21_14_0_10_31_34]|nr:MAG: hypothetical protein COT90_02825 [Candidatus Diapherotrites archaeon CG10_big_fil_rev_8_21_14_0_10_31_34]
MAKEQARILFEDLNPELKKTVKEIKSFRRIRSAMEIAFFIGSTSAGYFILAPASALLRKEAVKEIKKEYEKLAELTQEKGFFKSGEKKGKYPGEWNFNHEKVIEKFPVMHVNRRGDLIFRKPTKTEWIKMKLHVGRYRKLFKKPKTPEELFLERIKKGETKKEKKFNSIRERLKKIMRK